MLGARLIQAAAAVDPSPPTDRTSLVAGTYYADESNTGLLNPGALTTLSGDQVITTAGTVVEDKDIFGWVFIRAANVTMRNCRVRGGATPTASKRLVDCSHASCVNFVIEDCLLRPDVPTRFTDGIGGHDYKAYRLQITETVDGFRVNNTTSTTNPSDVEIYAPLVDRLAYFSPDDQHSDNQSHNDCIQWEGGSGLKVVGATLRARYSLTSGTTPRPDRGDGDIDDGRYNWGALVGMQVTPQGSAAGSPCTGLIFDDNTVEGGREGFLATGTGNAGQNIGRAYRNRFTRDQGEQGSGGNTTHTIDRRSTATLDAPTTGGNANLYIDGAAITVRSV